MFDAKMVEYIVFCAPKVPWCKYAALFDGRPLSDAIRVAFMRASDPTMSLNTFTDAVTELVDQAHRVIFGTPCVMAYIISNSSTKLLG